ncbi:MAG: hypothetical protein ABJA82_14755 [Myxococcales bacterium]
MRATIKCLCFSTLAAVVLTAAAPAASAQEFGEAHQLTISAERMFGFVHSSQSVEGQASRSQDEFSLLGNIGGAFTGYSWPRVAADIFVVPHVSLGGSVGVFHVSTDSGSLTGFLLAPRVGYAANLSSRVAIWPRAGFTYEHGSAEVGTGGLSVSSTANLFALTLEAPLVILLPPRVALTFGPAFDIGLTGSRSTGAVSVDTRVSDFGVHAGLLLYF